MANSGDIPNNIPMGASKALRRNAADTGFEAFTPSGAALEVKEVDGTPDVSGVTVVRVSNGSLTDDGGGQVTIATSGGIGGATGATDNAIIRADGVGGATVKGSGVTVSDNGDIDGVRSIIPHMRIGATGAPTTSAILDLAAATDGALLVPVLTTAERNALTATDGMVIYNASASQFQMYRAGAWENVGTSGSGTLTVSTEDNVTSVASVTVLKLRGTLINNGAGSVSNNPLGLIEAMRTGQFLM